MTAIEHSTAALSPCVALFIQSLLDQALEAGQTLSVAAEPDAGSSGQAAPQDRAPQCSAALRAEGLLTLSTLGSETC